ncbi:MAG: hypothetical protein ACRETW_07155 [Stenotrophobium sp.]
MAEDRIALMIPKLLAVAGILPVLLVVLWLGWKVTTKSREVQETWTRVEVRVIDLPNADTATIEFPWRGKNIRRELQRQHGRYVDGIEGLSGYKWVRKSQTLSVYVNPANLDEMSAATTSGLWGGAIALGVVALVLAGVGIFLMTAGDFTGAGASPLRDAAERAEMAELERAAANPRAFEPAAVSPQAHEHGPNYQGGGGIAENPLLRKILGYKPGSAFYIAGILVLFFGSVLWNQYRATGRLNPWPMIDRGTEQKIFWDKNPQLEYVNWYHRTGLVMARDRASGRTGMLDMFVVGNAQVHPRPCGGQQGAIPAAIYPGAGDMTCYAIEKPDTGAGTAFAYAVSFSAKAKDSQMSQFYRDLFGSRGKQVSVIQNDSFAVILEAEDAHEDTVARIAIRSSFDTAYGFLAWTSEFQ